MESPFASIDAIESASSSFWQSFSQSSLPQKTFFASTLFFLSKSLQMKPRKVALTKTHLLKYSKSSSQIKLCSKINWKKLEFFTETNEEEVRFGFRLGHSTNFQDFYTETSTELDLWIKKLTNLVILTDFDEDFVTIKEIGSGNYGSVMLVEDCFTHEQFAMKSIKKSLFRKAPSAVLSLKNEIQILRNLSHPSINKLERVYESETQVSLVLKYHPSGDLFERIVKREYFSESAASALAFNLLSALKYLHQHDYIHRDLKLENILMQSTSDTEVVICDFGLSCSVHDRNIPKCGSPGYVAPEILHNKPYSSKVDIFAVGVITYILLSGNSPFSADSQEQVLLLNKRCDLRFKEKVWSQCSDDAIEFIREMMNPDPAGRPSAQEALRHQWVCREKSGRVKEVTPVTDDGRSEGSELWRVPTVTRFDKPEMKKELRESQRVGSRISVNY